jgi:hypothetical protein
MERIMPGSDATNKLPTTEPPAPAPVLVEHAAASPGPGISGWRATIAIHPLAELFRSLSEAELRGLSEDIVKHGVRFPIAIFVGPLGKECELVNGRGPPLFACDDCAFVDQFIARRLQA